MADTSGRDGSPIGNGGGSSLTTSHGGEMAPFADAAAPVEYSGFADAAAASEQLLTRTLRHKWTIAVIFVLVSAVALPAIWLFVTPIYRAKATVRVSPVIPRVMYKTEETGVVPLYTNYLNTQVSQILSPDVLERVLDRKQDVQQTSWYKNDKQSFKDRILSRPKLPKMNRLLQSLAAKPRPRTELIDVAMISEDPNDSKLIVDAVVQEYKRLHLDKDRQGDGGRLRALEQRIQELRNELDTELSVRRAVSKQLGTNEPEELRKTHIMRLSKLEQEFDTIQRDMAVAAWELDKYGGLTDPSEDEGTGEGEAVEGQEAEGSTAVATLEGDEEKTPPNYELIFGRDSVWLDLDSDLKASQHSLERARARYGESHPRVRDLVAAVEYSQERLAEREKLLREAADANPGSDMLANSSGDGAIPVVPILEHKLRKAQLQGSLLNEQMEKQRAKVDSTSQLAEELSETEEKIGRLRQLEKSVRERLEVLEMERKAPGRVEVMLSMVPSEPHKDSRIVFSAMAIIFALGCGVGTALLRATMDSSMREASDVTATVRIPFLGQLPRTNANAILEGSDGLLQESLRMVRTALLERVASMDGGCSVLVTSPTARTGKTSLTIQLGRSLAQLGKKVLLVDADLRRSSLTERLNHEGEMGLTTILHGQATSEQVVLPTEVPGVDLMPVGKFHSKEDLELLADGVFKSCLRKWKSSYDFVLLDSPPVLPVADARILARQVDGTILTIRASHSRRGDANETLDRLRAAGGELLGTVLIGTDMRSRYHGSRDDYDYYYYGDGSRQLERSEA